MENSFEKEDDEDKLMSEYFRSKEFSQNMVKLINKETWDKGLPKYYVNDKKQIVEHWKDGTINIIKDSTYDRK